MQLNMEAAKLNTRPIGFCPRCAYPMDAGRCPECGEDVVRPARGDRNSRRSRVVRLVKRVAVAGLVLAALWFGGAYAVYNWWPDEHLLRIAGARGRFAPLANAVINYRWRRAESRVLAECKRIEALNSSLSEHEWAGRYEQFDDVLELGADNRFAGYYPSDAGYAGFFMGSVSSVGLDRIDLSTSFRQVWNPALPDNQYVRVRWAGRHYLVLPREMGYFCKNVQRGQAWALCRKSDLTKPLNGLPEVPPEYQSLLPPSPRTGTLIWIGVPVAGVRDPNAKVLIKNQTIQAVVNIGSNDGIKPGMQFMRWVGDSFPYQTIKAIESSEKTCLIECTTEEDDDGKYWNPVVGSKVSIWPDAAGQAKVKYEDPEAFDLGLGTAD